MQQISWKAMQEQTWLSEKGDPLGSVREIKIWPRYMQKQGCIPEKETFKILLDLEIQTNPPICVE